MIDNPIIINNVSLKFPHKTCFEDFSAIIYSGSKIGIIGRNGSGKSGLLKMLAGQPESEDGSIVAPDYSICYVPQVIESFNSLSWGQRFNKSLSAALATYPDLLLLDEPTNHLDSHNKKSLLRMLKAYARTVIVVSHDVGLLRTVVDTLWHIDNGSIRVFSGDYDDYMRELCTKRTNAEKALHALDLEQKEGHNSLMKEQQRASKSSAKGEKSIAQRKWPTIVSQAKARRAQETSGSKKYAIREKREEIQSQLADIRLPEVITPTFSLGAGDINNGTMVYVCDGAVRYGTNPVIDAINLSIMAKERVAILGNNGAGKSSLIKAILNHSDIITSGTWHLPRSLDIGYLDQHYANLNHADTVIESIEKLVPTWHHAEIRRHLNDFLFRKNEEVNIMVNFLSGGEKVRLSLAQIAAKTPQLLILDEITNNLTSVACKRGMSGIV